MASYRDQGANFRFEKRKDFRFEVQLPVELGHQKDDLSSICTNLSWKGVSVETSQSLGISEKLAVSVTIAPKQEPLRMLGQVVWKREIGAMDPNGNAVREIGIRFLRPLPSAWSFPGGPTLDEFEGPYQSGELPDVIPF